MADNTALKGTQKVLQTDGLTLDMENRLISGCNGTQRLYPKECQLLTLFMSNPGRVLSRKFLMKKVWDTDYLDDTKVLDVYICYLRRKIEEDPASPGGCTPFVVLVIASESQIFPQFPRPH